MTDGAVAALVTRTARDLVDSGVIKDPSRELHNLAVRAAELPELYDAPSASGFELTPQEPPIVLYEQLITSGVEDIDTYFRCLAELHKRRLRYEGILASQAFPLMEQVGPRAMLQYGHADPGALAVLLTWRKWIYDIDNRAAQETGYVFEPALVGALGGADVSASASPVKRRGDASRGRQVDCLLETAEGRWAYEFKIRVTIAASGQGRWAEELSFPGEARAAGYVPVLVVFDATENEKLGQLSQAYRAAQGETYIGQDAWQHIEQRSGPTMALFVEKYLRQPLTLLLEHEPDRYALPSIEFSMTDERIIVSIEGRLPIIIDRERNHGRLVEDEE